MAPKPASATKPSPGKKPTAAGGKKPDGKQAAVAMTGAPAGEEGTAFAPPKNKEEVLAQVNFEGLPNVPAEQILEILGAKYDKLVKVFAHYCKFSECKTIEMATRCKLGAPLSPCLEPIVPRGVRPRGAALRPPPQPGSCYQRRRPSHRGLRARPMHRHWRGLPADGQSGAERTRTRAQAAREGWSDEGGMGGWGDDVRAPCSPCSPPSRPSLPSRPPCL